MAWIKKLIYFIIYWIFLSSLINRYIWNSQIITLLPDALVIFAFLCDLKGKHELSKIVGKAPLTALGIFLLIGVAAAIVNSVDPTSFLWGLRMVIRYPLLFYMIYQHFDMRDVLKLKKAFYLSFWINAVFTLLQLATGVVGDAMGGIWSGNGQLANYILISIIIYGGDYYRGKITLRNFSFRVLFFFACAVWGEIKLLYFVIPLMLYIQYCFYRKFNFSHVLIVLFASIALIPVLRWGLSLYYDQDYVDSTFNVEEMEAYNKNDYGFSGFSYNRGTCVELATAQFLVDDPIQFIAGNGFGSATVSNLFPSEIGRRYANLTCYHFFTSSYVLIETGWGGFICFLLFYILLFFSFFSYYRKRKDPFIKYWSVIGCLTVIMTFIMIYYNNTPYADYYFPYVVWAVCFVAIRDRKRTKKFIPKRIKPCQKFQ